MRGLTLDPKYVLVIIGLKVGDNILAENIYMVTENDASACGFCSLKPSGPRINIGAVLTDTSMQPDKPLTDFNPCQECNECVKLCPVNAICKELPPPMGFRRSQCLKFVGQIREETNQRIRYCGHCYNRCPAGEMVKKTFNLSKWRTLLDLNDQQRRTLLKTLNVK
jgi:epoxyqueuosine reductase QueG